MLTSAVRPANRLDVPPRYARRVLDDGEVCDGVVLELRVGLHALVDVGLLVCFHGPAVAPDVDAAVGVGLGVCQPGLGDQTEEASEGRGYELDQPEVVLLGYALEVEVDDQDVHSLSFFRPEHATGPRKYVFVQ